MANKLGIVLPSGNTVLESEFYNLSLKEVTFHFTRIENYRDTEEELANMINEAPHAAELLSHANVNAIAFGCTAGSFLYGKNYDSKLINKMASRVAVPCISTSTSVIKALKEMKIHKLMFIAPYEKWLTQKGIEFLESNSFDVVGSKHLDITDLQYMASITPESIVELAKKEVHKNCDGLFISCTDFRAMSAAEQLEKDLGIPVITSNQATLWFLLKITGHNQPITGFGSLLKSF